MSGADATRYVAEIALVDKTMTEAFAKLAKLQHERSELTDEQHAELSAATEEIGAAAYLIKGWLAKVR